MFRLQNRFPEPDEGSHELLASRDDNHIPIPALSLRSDSAHTIPVGASSARNTVAFKQDTRVVSLYATCPVRVRLGDATVQAGPGDHFFPAGVYYDISLGGSPIGRATHIAVIRVDVDGILHVSEKT